MNQLSRILFFLTCLVSASLLGYGQCSVNAGTDVYGCSGIQEQLSAVGTANATGFVIEEVCIYDYNGGDCGFTGKICPMGIPPGDGYVENPGIQSSGSFSLANEAAAINSIKFDVYWTCGDAVIWRFHLNGVEIGNSGNQFLNGCVCEPVPYGTYPKAFLISGAQIDASWNYGGTNELSVSGDFVGTPTKVAGYKAEINYSARPKYVWDPITGLDDPTVPNPIATIQTSAIDYEVSYMDEAGCWSNDLVTVAPEELSTAITADLKTCNTHVTCANGNDGSLDLNVTGGLSGVYSYIWSGPAGFSSTTKTLTGLVAGRYYVTVQDVAGCTFKIDSVDIVAPEPMSVASVDLMAYPGGENIQCHGDANGSADITVIGGNICSPYSYAWTGPNGYTANSKSISGLTAGNYSVVITDVSGCSASHAITLTEPSPIDVTDLYSPQYLGGVNITCHGAADGNIQLEVVGGSDSNPYTYAWSGPGSFSGAVEDPAGVPAGHYQVTVTDQNGCEFVDDISLNEPAEMAVASIDPSVHNGGWNVTCAGLQDGTVDLEITGGMTASAYTYLWTGPSNFSSTSEDPSGMSDGVYTVMVEDANGCVLTQDVELIAPPQIGISLSSMGTGMVSCDGGNDGFFDIDINGGSGTGIYSYQWSGPQGFTSTSKNVHALIQGTYTIEVEDDNGCNTQETFEVTAPDPLEITSMTAISYPSGGNVSCHGESDGQISIDVQGGVGNYIYSWDGPGNLVGVVQNPSGLPAGDYNLSVTDENGCNANGFISLASPAEVLTPSILYNGTELICEPSPSYQWKRDGVDILGATGQKHTPEVSGVYSVVISNGFDCYASSNGMNIEVVSVGIDDPSNFADLKVFPNPAREVLNIEGSGITSIVLRDMQGKMIWNSGSLSPHGSNSNQIALSDYPQGIYLVQVNSETGKTVRKVVIEK